MRAPWRLMAVLTLLPWLALGAAAQTSPDAARRQGATIRQRSERSRRPRQDHQPGNDDPSAAAKPPPAPADTRESMCLMIESAARANGLPLEFFARVIWQESRFQADAIGPRTRSGDTRARHCAIHAGHRRRAAACSIRSIPCRRCRSRRNSCAELRGQFGNLGLAAAAYNAGPAARARLDRRYAQRCPPRRADTSWRSRGRRRTNGRGAQPASPRRRRPSCRQLMALLKRAPNPFVEKLQERIKLTAESPWGIQLSAGFSRDRVLASYARDCEPLCRGPVRPRSEHPELHLPQRGTRPFYQVRVGAETRAEANTLCATSRVRAVPAWCCAIGAGNRRSCYCAAIAARLGHLQRSVNVIRGGATGYFRRIPGRREQAYVPSA